MQPPVSTLPRSGFQSTDRPLKIVLLVCLGLFVVVFLMLQGPRGGVCMGNRLEEYAREYIEQKGLLNGRERIIVYFDATSDLDGSESAILTTERIICDVRGKVVAIPLPDVAHLEVRNDWSAGKLLASRGIGGKKFQIDIPTLNNSDLFVRELRNVTAKHNRKPDQ